MWSNEGMGPIRPRMQKVQNDEKKGTGGNNGGGGGGGGCWNIPRAGAERKRRLSKNLVRKGRGGGLRRRIAQASGNVIFQ